MLVYGKNVLKDVEPKKIRRVYLSENFHDKEIMHYLSENHIHYFFRPKNQLDKMVDRNHQGIVIDMDSYEYASFEDILEEDFIVALDHLEDVHNFGAIIRTCEAAGIKSILVPKDRSVRVNDIVMKTSVGAIDRVKIVLVNNLCEALRKLQKENYFVYAAFMDGEDYQRIDYANKKVLVIGNEGKGISNVVEAITDVRVGIPMQGKVNSLNASVAAGILIFQMNR